MSRTTNAREQVVCPLLPVNSYHFIYATTPDSIPLLSLIHGMAGIFCILHWNCIVFTALGLGNMAVCRRCVCVCDGLGAVAALHSLNVNFHLKNWSSHWNPFVLKKFLVDIVSYDASRVVRLRFHGKISIMDATADRCTVRYQHNSIVYFIKSKIW